MKRCYWLLILLLLLPASLFAEWKLNPFTGKLDYYEPISGNSAAFSTWSGAHRRGTTAHPLATTTTPGFMASTDKSSLDNLVSKAQTLINVKDYGAKGDTRVFQSNGNISAASNVFNTYSSTFSGGDVGKRMVVYSVGNDIATTITGYTNPTTVTLGANAAVNITNANWYFGTDDTTAIDNAIAAIPPTGAALFFPFGKYLDRHSITVNNKPITIYGEGQGVSEIMWDFTAVNLPGIVINQNKPLYYTEIRDLKLTHMRTGESAAITVDHTNDLTSNSWATTNVKIANTHLTQPYPEGTTSFGWDVGIKLRYVQSAEVLRTKFYGARGTTTYPFDTPLATAFLDLDANLRDSVQHTFVGNQVVGPYYGYKIRGMTEGIYITENNLVAVDIGVDYAANAGNVEPQLQAFNNHMNVYQYGIKLGSIGQYNISKNLIYAHQDSWVSTVYGIHDTAYNAGYSQISQIEGNIFNHNASTKIFKPINLVDGDNIRVAGNTFDLNNIAGGVAITANRFIQLGANTYIRCPTSTSFVNTPISDLPPAPHYTASDRNILFNNVGAIDDSSSLKFDTSNNLIVNGGNLAVGATAPISKFSVTDNATIVQRGITSEQNNDGSYGGIVSLAKKRATSPYTVQSGDSIGDIQFLGFDGTSYTRGGIIRYLVKGPVTTGSIPGDMIFYPSLTERLRITGRGPVKFANLSSSSPTFTNYSCNVTHRGEMYVSQGGAGTDQLRLCVQSGGTYSWKYVTINFIWPVGAWGITRRREYWVKLLKK